MALVFFSEKYFQLNVPDRRAYLKILLKDFTKCEAILLLWQLLRSTLISSGSTMCYRTIKYVASSENAKVSNVRYCLSRSSFSRLPVR